MKKFFVITIIALVAVTVTIAHAEEAAKKFSREDAIEITAQALSKMEKPDFSAYNENDVCRIFNKWYLEEEKPFCEIQKRVYTLSGGSVSLETANPEDFSEIVRGPAKYYLLKCPKGVIKVTIGPYAKPVWFSK